LFLWMEGRKERQREGNRRKGYELGCLAIVRLSENIVF
jgi:hypothetical protein